MMVQILVMVVLALVVATPATAAHTFFAGGLVADATMPRGYGYAVDGVLQTAAVTPNPSFETADANGAAGWTFTGDEGTWTRTREDAAPGEGSHSVKFVATAGGGVRTLTSPVVQLCPAPCDVPKVYRGRVWLKMVGLGGNNNSGPGLWASFVRQADGGKGPVAGRVPIHIPMLPRDEQPMLFPTYLASTPAANVKYKTDGWIQYESELIYATTPIQAQLQISVPVTRPALTTGTAYIDGFVLEEVLTPPLQVFLSYPNFRGYLFSDDAGYALHNRPPGHLLAVLTTLPEKGFSLPAYTAACTIREEVSGTVLRSSTFPITRTYQPVTMNAADMRTDRPYLFQCTLTRAGNSSVHTYPPYRISLVPAAAKPEMQFRMDERHAIYTMGQRKFWGFGYEALGETPTNPASWENALWALSPTNECRADTKVLNPKTNRYQCPPNSVSTRHYGAMPYSLWMDSHLAGTTSPAVLDALMTNLASHGACYVHEFNAAYNIRIKGPNPKFSGWKNPFVQYLQGKPGFCGFFTLDEQNSYVMPIYRDEVHARLKRLSPTTATFGVGHPGRIAALWRDSVDFYSTDAGCIRGGNEALSFPSGPGITPQESCITTPGSWNTLPTVAANNRNLRLRAYYGNVLKGGGRPFGHFLWVVNFVVFSKAPPGWRQPTEAEIRAQALTAMIEGAKGLAVNQLGNNTGGVYQWGGWEGANAYKEWTCAAEPLGPGGLPPAKNQAKTWCASKETHTRLVERVMVEMASYQDVWYADPVLERLVSITEGSSKVACGGVADSVCDGGTDGYVRCTVRTHDGKGYVACYNNTPTRRTVTLQWDAPISSVKMDGRTRGNGTPLTPASSTTFQASFGPWDTHIYEIQ